MENNISEEVKAAKERFAMHMYGAIWFANKAPPGAGLHAQTINVPLDRGLPAIRKECEPPNLEQAQKNASKALLAFRGGQKAKQGKQH